MGVDKQTVESTTESYELLSRMRSNCDYICGPTGATRITASLRPPMIKVDSSEIALLTRGIGYDMEDVLEILIGENNGYK